MRSRDPRGDERVFPAALALSEASPDDASHRLESHEGPVKRQRSEPTGKRLAALDRDRGCVEGGGDVADLLFGQRTAGLAQPKCELEVFPGAHDLRRGTAAMR